MPRNKVREYKHYLYKIPQKSGHLTNGQILLAKDEFRCELTLHLSCFIEAQTKKKFGRDIGNPPYRIFENLDDLIFGFDGIIHEDVFISDFETKVSRNVSNKLLGNIVGKKLYLKVFDLFQSFTGYEIRFNSEENNYYLYL